MKRHSLNIEKSPDERGENVHIENFTFPGYDIFREDVEICIIPNWKPFSG